MASTSRRSSRQALTTHVTDSSNSNIIFLNLLKISPDTRFALTRRCRTMSVDGAAPCRRLGPSSTFAGVDIDDVVQNAVVTDIDAEQRRSILTDVVIILDFQVLLSLGVRAVEGGGDSSAAAMATRSSDGPDGRPCPPAPFLNGARWWRLAMSTPEDEDSASDTDLQSNREEKLEI